MIGILHRVAYIVVKYDIYYSELKGASDFVSFESMTRSLDDQP